MFSLGVMSYWLNYLGYLFQHLLPAVFNKFVLNSTLYKQTRVMGSSFIKSVNVQVFNNKIIAYQMDLMPEKHMPIQILTEGEKEKRHIRKRQSHNPQSSILLIYSWSLHWLHGTVQHVCAIQHLNGLFNFSACLPFCGDHIWQLWLREKRDTQLKLQSQAREFHM